MSADPSSEGSSVTTSTPSSTATQPTSTSSTRPRATSTRQSQVKVLGQWTLTQDIIGRGQFGKVYRGFHNKTHEPVAVKVVQTTSISMVEVREMQRLKGHPNILRLLDQQQNEKFLVLILEYCDGGDLQALINERKLKGKPEATRRLFRQLLQGLHAIHEKNLMHRDIKPANILIAGTDLETATIKIADLGFAKSCRDAGDMYKSFAGTPGYMAPERLKGLEYNFQAEIWAAGVILYEMLYGGRPYKAETQHELLRMCLRPPEMPVVEGQVGEDAIDLLRQMLVYDPEKRIAIADALNHKWLKPIGAASHQQQQTGTGTSSPLPSGTAVTSISTEGRNTVKTPTQLEPKLISVGTGTSPVHLPSSAGNTVLSAPSLPAVPNQKDQATTAPSGRSTGTGTPATRGGQVPSTTPSPPPATTAATGVGVTSPSEEEEMVQPFRPSTKTATKTPSATTDGTGDSKIQNKHADPTAGVPDAASKGEARESTSSGAAMIEPALGVVHRRTSSAERPSSCVPENCSITSLTNALSTQAMVCVDHAKTVVQVAGQENDPARSAVLYAYASSILKDACGEDARRLSTSCVEMARSLITRVRPETETRSPPELLVAYAIRIGREAATEEQFDNFYCGANNDPIVEVYKVGKAALDVLLTFERHNLTSGEYETVRQLAQQFEFRIRTCMG